MAHHPDAPALSALLLVVLAAGLNVCCTSSASPATPPKITISGSTASVSQPATPIISTPGSTVITAATSATVSLRTTLGLTYTGSVNTAPEVGDLTTTPVSGTVTTHVTTSPWSSSGQQSTEHPLASGTSAANPTTDVMIPSQTPATTSQILSESPTIITTSNMTNSGTAGVTQSSSLETSAVTVIPSEKLPTKEATSGKTPTALVTSSGPEEKDTSSQGPLANKATPEASHIHDATFSAGVTVQEVQHALSSGSIAAITVTVIAVVLLVFGLAAFLKIRHSSYGRLFDDHDYGSWGNYNNPLYDDS